MTEIHDVHMQLIGLAMGDERLTHAEFIHEATQDPSAFYAFRPHEIKKLMDLCMQSGRQQLQQELDAAEWPYGATVKIRWAGYGPHHDCIGWAKRTSSGELVSAYSLLPLDAEQWEVVETRVSSPEE